MTKRWSSTASMDGQTKRQASKTARREEQQGLSEWGVRALGLDTPCRCGHEDGLHDSNGRCAVFGCECIAFGEIGTHGGGRDDSPVSGGSNPDSKPPTNT